MGGHGDIWQKNVGEELSGEIDVGQFNRRMNPGFIGPGTRVESSEAASQTTLGQQFGGVDR